MDLISVIIPTYNNANYILEAIETIIKQTYCKHEIIVIDDGSTDNTKEVLNELIENRVIRYYYQENKGPGAARNLGINRAKGEYITFLDADDSLTLDSLEKKYKLIRTDSELRIVFSNYFVCTSQGIKKKEIHNDFMRMFKGIIRNTTNGFIIKGKFSDIFEIPFLIPTISVLLDKNIFDKIGNFRTDVSIGEDRDMWIRAVEHSPAVGYVDLPLAYYNTFRSNLTKKDPIEYAHTRLRMNYYLLQKYKILQVKNVNRVINIRLSWIYYDMGTYYYRENQKINAYKAFFKSIYFNPLNYLAYKFMLRSLVPNKIKITINKLSKVE
jgi:glycosyltransferase involved in cell wall biosynthesis